MKRLLLTTSTIAAIAALGSCGGEEDGDGVVTMPATGSTSSTSPTGPDPANTGVGPVVPVGPNLGNGGGPGVPTPMGTGGAGPAMPPTSTCGNSVVNVGEECDDGNMTPGDGCENDCKRTPPAVAPTAECGNMIVEAGEQCDDGNMTPDDGCENDCKTSIAASCGDGTVDEGEECDDMNMTPGDGCENNCTLTVVIECGNGIPEEGEECDDGNMTPDDGCEEDCTMTVELPPVICGDGEVGEGEECDDGNAENGDGCEADCTIGDVAPVIPTIEELFPPGNDGPLDGSLRVSGCSEANTQGTDCASDGAYLIVNGAGTKINCQGALDVNHTYDVAGTPGTRYSVTMHFYGIMEPKDYGAGVTREAAPGRPGNQDNGSDPVSFATAPAGYSYPVSDYNTYELHVDDEENNEVGIYYMNADTSQGHWTYVIDYARPIEVVGGGRIRVRVYDRNCRMIKNCGPNNTASNQCAGIANNRVINLAAASPAPANAFAPMGLSQPALISSRDAGSAGQWWLIDIVSVDSME